MNEGGKEEGTGYSTLCNRVRGDGDLGLSLLLSLSLAGWLAGDCSGKWPSNVTTNGHCCRTEGGREKGAQKMGESVSQDSGRRKKEGSAVQCSGSGASFFFLRESARGTEYRADSFYNPRLRETLHWTYPVARSLVDLGQ